MVQFHNAPSNFVNLASGETGIGYQSPHDNLFQNNGKRNLFSQNWSENDAKKNRRQVFYDIFYLHDWVGDKMTKTGRADLMKCT